MRSRPCAAIEAIAHWAEFNPQSPALIEPEGITLNYKELWAQIDGLSSRLREAGVGFGQRVAVLSPQGPLQVISVIGALNHHVCLPLQPKTTVAEVEFSLRRLSASALIASPEYEAEAQAAIEMGLTVLDARYGESAENWQFRTPVSASNQPAAQSEAILFLITSATTNHSKLVPLTGANLNAGIDARCGSLHLAASDRLLLMTSLCHIIGVENALAQLVVGGVLIATRGFEPAAYLRWLDDLKPTWYDCAPTVHHAALVQLKSSPLNFPVSLRFVQSAGAPLPNEVRQEFEQTFHVPVFNDYGMTEACPIAVDAFLCGNRVSDSAGRSCGLEIAIINSSGEFVPNGEEGEIVVRGPAVFSGYEDDFEANRNAFHNGWFKTGDLGRLDREGNLFVTGRLKEMINRGGEKILPGEVDAVLASHPAVLEAATFAVPHPTLGEDVACAVALRPGTEAQVNAPELRRFAADRLAPFKVPHRIRFVDRIPRGELGKPQRWVLAERFGATGKNGPTPPDLEDRLSAVEIYDLQDRIREIWARILNCDDVGLDVDFFEAGGDSLAAITMLAEVDQRLGSKTSAFAASFIDEPTIANLTTLVGKPELPRPNYGAPSDMQIFSVLNDNSGRPFYCVPAIEDEGIYFRRLAKHLHGIMNVKIVRPANTFYSQGLFTFERAGEDVAALILRQQPEGPYFVGGLCTGGVVAYEAARLLALRKQDVRLVFFDVIMPGPYTLLANFDRWLADRLRKRRAAREDRISQGLESPEIAAQSAPGFTMTPPHFVGSFVNNLPVRLRRVLWSSMVPLRRLFSPLEHTRLVQWLILRSQEDFFPFFRARAIDAPILHFLCSNGMGPGHNASRRRWRAVARRGIEEHFVPVYHDGILYESNLPGIVAILTKWCGIQPDASEPEVAAIERRHKAVERPAPYS